MSFWRLGAGPSSACSSRSRPQPRSSIAPRWWPSCSRCAEAALGINGFQVISDVTVVSLLRPLYTQPKLESFSFTPTLKSFEWQCEPKLVLARTLAITCRLIAECHTCPAIWFSLITAYYWNYHGQLSHRKVAAVWIKKVKKGPSAFDFMFLLLVVIIVLLYYR